VRMWRCEDVKMWGCEDVKMRRCEDEKMWRWEDVKMRRCEDVRTWRCEDVRCEDVKMRRWEDVRMWRWADVKMRRWEDVKMRRCEDEKMWGWEDVKMRRCEDEQMWSEDVLWRCENVWQTPTIRRTLRSDALGEKSAQRTMETAWNFYVPASNVDNRKLHNRKATPQFAVINCAFDLAFPISHAWLIRLLGRWYDLGHWPSS